MNPAPITVPGEVHTTTPPGTVFGYLSDPANQVEWTPNFVELISGPDGPPVELWPSGVTRLAGPVMKLLVKRMIVDLNRQMKSVLDSL
jgi:hypothetical protein